MQWTAYYKLVNSLLTASMALVHGNCLEPRIFIASIVGFKLIDSTWNNMKQKQKQKGFYRFWPCTSFSSLSILNQNHASTYSNWTFLRDRMEFLDHQETIGSLYIHSAFILHYWRKIVPDICSNSNIIIRLLDCFNYYLTLLVNHLS